MKTNTRWKLTAICAIALTVAACSQNDSSSTLNGAAGTIVAAKRTAVGDIAAVEVIAEDSAAAAAATSSATASASIRADAEAAQGTGGSNASDKRGKGSEGRRFKH